MLNFEIKPIFGNFLWWSSRILGLFGNKILVEQQRSINVVVSTMLQHHPIHNLILTSPKIFCALTSKAGQLT